ncbi:MAG: hypothetical protein ABEI74_04945 [Candidatus Pacearchaeota archaeon]
MQKYSENQLIFDYIKPQNPITKGFVYADEFLAGHLKKYKNSMEKGIGNIIEDAGLKIKDSKTIPWENKSPEQYDILALWICE